jgi:uncharacterized protein YjaZ
MNPGFSGALDAQLELFTHPQAERSAVFLEKVLRPMAPALAPPGTGADTMDLLAVARQYHFLDPQGDPRDYDAAFALLRDAGTVDACRDVLQRAHRALAPEKNGIDIAVRGHVIVADPHATQMLDPDDGYTGYGGHSGHAVVHVDPRPENVRNIPAALAHEYHHNVRLAFEPWSAGTTVGQYAILEGLAEAFAVELCGIDRAGPWVTRQTPAERERAREIVGGALDVTGWNEVRAYVFGDWVAAQVGLPQRGLVRSAGYAVGFDCVRAYCLRTGKSAAQATYVPWREIAAECGYFAMSAISSPESNA